MRKGGGLLLVLAIPLALYAAWQVKGVVRTDMVVSDPPPDRGSSKEQLLVTKEKATKWASDARKASTVALQYRQAEAGDAPADASAAEVVKASAARAADLSDLDLFLTGVENAKFVGKLKEDYARWKIDSDRARDDGRKVTEWLARPVVVTSAADATRAMSDLEERLTTYQTGSNFASRRQAALWRLRGRLAVIKELSVQADTQYPAAVSVALPLRPGNDAMKTALATFAAVQSQVKLLNGDLKLAEEEKADLTGALRGEIDDRLAIAAKCRARENLLGLFAQENLFTNATGATAWLRDVAALYRDTKDEDDKRRIRKKVQEFCEAFLPAAVRLDDQVLFKDKPVQRKKVLVEYEPAAGAERVQVPLTDSTEGLNEFNVAKMYPGKTTEVRHDGAPGRPADLAPTLVSRAAELYNEARKAVPPGITGAKWSVKSVEELKKKCEAQKDLVDKLDKLKLPRAKGDTSPDEEQKILARFDGLIEGLKACADLIENAP